MWKELAKPTLIPIAPSLAESTAESDELTESQPAPI